MKKEAKVHMLPTDRSYLTISGGKLSYDDVDYAESGFIKPQHLYITTDEEIKKGDWFINLGSGGHPGVAIYQANSENSKVINEFKFPEIKKIIATTDTELHYNKVVEEDMHMYKESLPHIPQHIIEAYVKKPFDEVLVEYEEWTTMYRGMANYKLKLNQDGTLAVSLVEEKMYSKEEVEALMGLGYELGKQGGSLTDLKNLTEGL
jgi:hypothetical protein